MRRPLSALLLVLALGAAPAAPARAGFVNGFQLLQWCQNETSTFCGGYLAALVDYQDLLHQADARSLRFCLPDNTKVSDLRRLAVDELLRQEGELRKLAASLLLPLFVKQFPCR